ncbi:MAG: alpha/beta hydrolase family protein [Planctomycetaceae bacterium]
MRTSRRQLQILAGILFLSGMASSLFASEKAREVSRVVEPGSTIGDPRLGPLRVLNDKYHPWEPPATREEWEREAQRVRERLLVSNGLWPMPPKAELTPTIHGKIDRGEYTIEKVFFASHPGHYVTGNLYRPTKTTLPARKAGVLCPHGHWQNGRFYDAGDKEARHQIDITAERDISGARYPLQARMAQLARMGCVVFHYDMVGNADSKQIGHAAGFKDVEAGLRMQNAMGLQTFNSICALDFLLSLPDVDPERIGVTGSSGGGTQTFMLCAVDPRPKVAFPAVMVSTAMQGGCVCENCEHLRIGINNVTIASLFAPKPIAMSGANDWTIDFETSGLPEMKRIYGLYGRSDLVQAKVYPQYGHNYNRVAREMMYNWFNTYLALGASAPVSEEDFWPVDPKDLSVFDADHPLPKDSVPVEGLRKHLTEVASKQFEALIPANADQLAEYRRVVGAAARVLLDDQMPGKDELSISSRTSDLAPGVVLTKGTVTRRAGKERVPFVSLAPPKTSTSGTAVVWLDGAGKSHLFGEDGQPTAPVRKLVDAGHVVLSADLFLTGEFVEPGKEPAYPKVDQNYDGYTFGYNRTVVANRVRDILAVIGGLSANETPPKKIVLVGTGDAGPWTLLAAGLAGDKVAETIADARSFLFGKVTATTDPMFLPGALKYGDLPGLAALAAPQTLTVAGLKEISEAERKPLNAAYAAAGASIQLRDEPLTADLVAQQLAK